ncbi:hypothetical protein WOLCODRAFT_29008 [Wolfiporia cocos MD-104 SS10]|uniref:Uncharacterized protein n=1 Tax=Wolfiporia cocos (strain MD-104) TaxID=742152 RepID=A0A2H3JBR2_WOLCO|nr:hypothetical protein WOLCODRAFT_29008 [Wolfiporia cocos MD-104 SS10]
MRPLNSLSGANPHSVQPLRVTDADLSRNVGLRDLSIEIIDRDIPAALLERAEIYGVIQRIISSTCPTVLEKITIYVWFNPSASGPSIMSHVLLALRRGVYPPDYPLAPERYTSLKSVELKFCFVDETSTR